uniref:RRM domain-containing protein n=1 Tax=Panagrolaimus sp. JU765 TaxID=591449 RepID=A0AC34QT63_9BILA
MAEDAADDISAQNVRDEEKNVSPSPFSDDDTARSVDDFMKNPLTSLGSWVDVMVNEEGFIPDLSKPIHDDKAVEQAAIEPFEHQCVIVRGSDMMYCQVPSVGPFHILIFGIPQNVTDAEVYMLFGGSRSIDTYLYRSDIAEMLIKFRERQHLVSALLKQDMNFKEKPLRLGVVLLDGQIHDFFEHNKKHRAFDTTTILFSGAFDKTYVCQEDGHILDDYDDVFETESISSASQFSSSRGYNNDVRSDCSYISYQCNTLPNSRTRTESVTSVQSFRSTSDRYQYKEGYSRKFSNNALPPLPSQSEESYITEKDKRTTSVVEKPSRRDTRGSTTSLASSIASTQRPKINPFGDAKPDDKLGQKLLLKEKELLAQKENEKQNKNFVPSFMVDFSQPPPNYQPPVIEPVVQPVQRPEINPKTVRIEKRPDNVPPAGPNAQFWVNKNFPMPADFHPSMMRTPASPSQSNLTIGNETIDVTKPPPPVPQALKPDKSEGKKIARQFVNKNMTTFFNSSNQYKSGQEHHHNRPNNRALPPTGPINRKKSSSMDQKSKHTTSVAGQKSQSAPIAQEIVQNSSGKSSPDNASKRPNSANSAMSFVTAESEISSAELPRVPGSSDNIPERVNELTEEQRRHSWEGQKSPGKKRENVPFKSRFDKRKVMTFHNSNRKSSDTYSRSSSRSTPQYQSASSVFLDANEDVCLSDVQETKESTPVKEEPKKEVKAVTKTKNYEKRDRSLPLSRPHTASHDKSNPLNLESQKTETMSAPATPSGSSKKKKAKAKQNQKLANNKFGALADNFEI